jgi:hypothetical protein
VLAGGLVLLFFSFASYTNLSAAADDDDNDDDELKASDALSSRRIQNEKGVGVARTQIIDLL